MDNGNLIFFLGGHDLEMLTIRRLLEQEAPEQFHDKSLGWGARASAYAKEINKAIEEHCNPVLVELENDLQLDPEQIICADHHGERAGKDRPTSLHQVFTLLGLPPERWTRRFELVAANDRGYIPALVEVGATLEEITLIRAEDRQAQGITAEQEAAAEEAIQQPETCAAGRLTIVRLPHNRSAAVTDRLQPELGGPGYDNLLILSPAEINFYGSGELVQLLDRTFPGGWYGGALPYYGFWGHGAPLSSDEAVLHCLEQALDEG